jgi:hypothetical protein
MLRMQKTGMGQGWGFSASKPLKIKASETQNPTDLGSFVQPNPISFSLPNGTEGRVWLARKQNSDDNYSKIIGDDRWWRLNVIDLSKRRPASAKVRAILHTNDDGTYQVTIAYDTNHGDD